MNITPVSLPKNLPRPMNWPEAMGSSGERGRHIGFEAFKAHNSKILVIDPEAASVVVRIFRHVCAGRIFIRMNRENIPSPKAYHLIKHGKARKVKRTRKSINHLWLGNFISSIIQNPVILAVWLPIKQNKAIIKEKRSKSGAAA